jgi:hypothetical protein
MKHYKRTINRLRKRKEWQNKFLEHIALKFSQAKPSTLKLRLIHIKRRFFSSGLLEMLLMSQLEQQIEASKDLGENVINFNKYKR